MQCSKRNKCNALHVTFVTFATIKFSILPLFLKVERMKKELSPVGLTLLFDDTGLVGGEEVLQVGYLLL